MIWCFSISRPRKNYRKWTWETSCVYPWWNDVGQKYLFAAQQLLSYVFFASKCKCLLLPKRLSESKSILCLGLIGFGFRSLNESLILNRTTIVTNSMPNPFSSFHISLWWSLKSVGVHKWLHWPWFISWASAILGSINLSIYFLLFNLKQ